MSHVLDLSPSFHGLLSKVQALHRDVYALYDLVSSFFRLKAPLQPLQPLTQHRLDGSTYRL